MPHARAFSRRIGAVILMLIFAVTIFPSVQARTGQRAGQERDTRHPFRFDLRLRVSRNNNNYLYEYSLQQVDTGRTRYNELSHFSLVLPCGESGYRTIRGVQAGGWSVEREGNIYEPTISRAEVWGLKFYPTFSIRPDGDGTSRGDRVWNFSFVSECAPVRGQWVAKGDEVDNVGDIDVPCGCDNSAFVDRDNDRDARIDDRPSNRDRDRDRDRELDRNPEFRNDNRANNTGQIVVNRNEIIIATSTILKLRMQSRLTSATAKVGDTFKAVLVDDIRADNLSVLPKGCQVEGRVTSVVAAQRGSKSGTIGIDFDKLILPSGRTVKLVGELTSLNSEEQKQIDEEGRVKGSAAKRNVVFIGGGAAGGAAIGAIAGGGKGAGIGAAAGAGIGILGAVLSKGQEAVVEAGTEFGMALTEPLRIPRATSTNGTNASGSASFTKSDYRKLYSDKDTVLRAQSRLRELGYLRSAPNGRLNAVTKRALLRFQNDNRLTPTGNLDYPTAVTLGIDVN